MPATPEAMNCPSCGAPVSAGATQCEHCGARLQMVACPSCFGMVFAGYKFCPHCGAALAREEVDTAKTELCPRCQVNMQAVVIGKTNLRECPKCEGIWADTASLQKICEDREEQTAVLGNAAPLPQEENWDENIHYLKCPICNSFMNRVNFAHCSHVVVNVCKAHGTWFDKDQLRRIVEFIRGGGMEQARAEEIAELQRRQSALRAAQIGGGAMDVEESPLLSRKKNYDDLGSGIASAAAHLFTSFLGMED